MVYLKHWTIAPMDLEDATSVHDFISLKDWLVNPLAERNLDKEKYFSKQGCIRLTGATTKNLHIDTTIVSIGNNLDYPQQGPLLEVGTENEIYLMASKGGSLCVID